MDVLNVARILSVKKTGRFYPATVDVDSYLDHTLCKNPLVLEITTERNALERTMLHFSCYQKKVERQEESGTYRCTIYYDTKTGHGSGACHGRPLLFPLLSKKYPCRKGTVHR